MKRVQLVRHTGGSSETFVGLEGEVTIDLTNKQVRVHDGITPGGMPQARQDLSTTQAATNSNDGKMTAALVTLLESLDALTAVHETRLDTIEANILPGGTVALFMQAAAPTGWTLNTTHNNKALRIVNTAGGGSGGATAFTSVFGAGKSTGSTALSVTQIPLHAHTFSATTGAAGSHSHTVNIPSGSDVNHAGIGPIANNASPQTFTTSTVGDHTHSVSGTTGTNGGTDGHTHTLSLDLQYVDIIACTKNAF